MAVDSEDCWNSAATVCGLNTDPSNSATYVPAATAQALAIAFPGAEKKSLQACRTASLVNAASSPPRMVAASSASTVTVTVLSWIVSRRCSPKVRSRPACGSVPPAGGGGAGGPVSGGEGGGGGGGSVFSSCGAGG